ncbi:MAG: hypothetical protein K1000chlam3_01668 [Chlamydiae bacterium]|nr:hypothetical protein [Chlamydiota bacterium]
MKRQLYVIVFLFCLLGFVARGYAFPQYYCTGANSMYYNHLLNLIGSIHKYNYKELKEIAVFDLGLSEEELANLKRIKKVSIHRVRMTHPDLLTYFHIPMGYKTTFFGWYAWKPVIIKQALEKFPYALWLDAGTTVCRSLDVLFQYIEQSKYFICTIGDPNKPPLWPVGKRVTKFLAEQLKLDEHPDKDWICAQECVMGGIIGVAQDGQHYFLNDMYEMSKDLRYYADDGTAPGGWAIASHDQAVLSLLAYSRHLNVHIQDLTQVTPIKLPVDGKTNSVYITMEDGYVNYDRTWIFSSRGSMSHYSEHLSKIRYE